MVDEELMVDEEVVSFNSPFKEEVEAVELKDLVLTATYIVDGIVITYQWLTKEEAIKRALAVQKRWKGIEREEEIRASIMGEESALQ